MLQRRSATVSMTMVVMVMMMLMMLLGTGVETAPTERGSLKPPDSSSSLGKSQPSGVSLPPERSEPSPHSLSRHLRQWLLTAKPTGAEGSAKTTEKITATGGRLDRRLWISPVTASPGRRAQMLKMISALEELHRTINSTLSTRITLMPRAKGRNSGRKNKGVAVAEGSVKPTTVAPVEVGGIASRASTDIINPSNLTGRNFKKSLPPQPKKTNKRVCFWKYCSQN